jgi:hypothetical protein
LVCPNGSAEGDAATPCVEYLKARFSLTVEPLELLSLLPDVATAVMARRKASRYERRRFLQFCLGDSVRLDLLVVRAALVTVNAY